MDYKPITNTLLKYTPKIHNTEYSAIRVPFQITPDDTFVDSNINSNLSKTYNDSILLYFLTLI